jgi:hypothetical protein
MPYVILRDKDFSKGGRPLFLIDHGVGKAMSNQRKDVALVQYFLKVLLHTNQPYRGVLLAPPPGPLTLDVSGVWDSNSAAYLKKWEESVYAPGKATFNVPAPFPGTVVPTRQGGRKINHLNEMCREIIGAYAHSILMMPNAALPDWVRSDFFYQ